MALTSRQQANQRGFYAAVQLGLTITQLQDALRAGRIFETDLLIIGERYFWAYEGVRRVFPEAKNPNPSKGKLLAKLIKPHPPDPEMFLNDWKRTRGVTQRAENWAKRGHLGKMTYKTDPKTGDQSTYLLEVAVADRYLERRRGQEVYVQPAATIATPLPTRNLKTTKQVAAEYNVGEEAVMRARRHGNVDFVQVGQKRWLIDLDGPKTIAWLADLPERQARMAKVSASNPRLHSSNSVS